MTRPHELEVSSRWTEEEWDEFVNQSPDASGYHDHRWRRVFENAFGHETDYLVARAEAQIVGVLPLVIMRSWLFGRFMVSLPFVNYGGALGDAPAVRALVETAVERCRARRLTYLELRHVSRRFPEYPVRQHKVAMLLALESNETSMWKRLDHKVRNQVRKAEKSGLRAEAGGAELVSDFYEVFAENMRDLGTPVYSRRFFEQMHAQFPGSVETVLVRLGDKAVAGAISYSHHERLEVPWACSLRSHRAMCPNMLLYWTLMTRAIAAGKTTLDFGRSTPEEGTYHFKRQWGAVPQSLSWEYPYLAGRQLPDQSPKNPKFRTGIELWRRLPVPVATLLGPSIVRGIP